MDQFSLWKRTLADQPDGFNQQREILRQAFLSFRERAAQLVNEIHTLLPQLTVHDITHLDALWRVADEIAGPGYELNPAEAFVLGGAFLLHDAAHVLAAYEDGLAGIKKTVEWRDLIAQRFDGVEPATASAEERLALFQVLRYLHAKQAHNLPKLTWKVPSTGARLHLLEHHDLRAYYGDLIGEIAESHHWPAHRVAETFEHRNVNAPPCLTPANWSVDALKVAFLLRTADAAHIDGLRAPWFLFALRSPEGISQSHWHFQAKLGQPKRTERGELRLSSGSPFGTSEQQAWWLAHETASMIGRELRAAESFMRDADRPTFAIRSVEHVSTPETFATNVRTSGWEPVNVAPKIGNVAKVIANLGGAKLYGDRPDLALRELIQNAADAVRALRALGGIDQLEGKIEVALTSDGDSTWLHVTDTGIGMSRFVLTEVLLDFGNSLWSSDSLLSEIPGLASKDFKAVGQFGIGFYSIFMLGKQVSVTTRRYRRAEEDKSDQWLLEFNSGLAGRPTLRQPGPSEELFRSGTKVSVKMDEGTLTALLASPRYDAFTEVGRPFTLDEPPTSVENSSANRPMRMARVVAKLCPTLDIAVGVRVDDVPIAAINPNDWQTLPTTKLLRRLYLTNADETQLDYRLLDLREDSGQLVGRVGFAGNRDFHAITTYRGISSGILYGFVGVALGHNNDDLARGESPPVASASAWTRWAQDWIDAAGRTHPDVLAGIHPLVPHLDLPVYRLNGEVLTEGQLLERLESYSELLACDGLDYDDSQIDIPVEDVDLHFQSRDGIVFLPTSGYRAATALAGVRIDYSERLESALTAAWREFEAQIDDGAVIGSVKGEEVVRLVTRYRRGSDELP